MLKIFLAVLLVVVATISFAGKPQNGVMYDANIIRVIDGDTIVIVAEFLPLPLKPELSVRVYGVDTPEKGFRAKCTREDRLGQSASIFTKMMIANSTTHQVIIYGWDKYGGRVLGDVILDGVSLREQLIANGYARPYFGDAKQSWC